MASFSEFARAREISPGQKQEFIDAKVALEAAQRAKAGEYTLDTYKQAQELLVMGDNARQFKDPLSKAIRRNHGFLIFPMAQIGNNIKLGRNHYDRLFYGEKSKRSWSSSKW